MKAIVLKAFKDAPTGVTYEVGQEVEYNEKLEKLGFVVKLETASEPKKAPRKKVVKE